MATKCYLVFEGATVVGKRALAPEPGQPAPLPDPGWVEVPMSAFLRAEIGGVVGPDGFERPSRFQRPETNAERACRLDAQVRDLLKRVDALERAVRRG